MSNVISQNLQTLPATGAPPKSRIRDANSALAIVYDLIQGAQERNRKQALLQGMLDGNPPYSQSALRASGQAYRSNFASMEGKSIALAAMSPYYDLFASGRTFAEVNLDLPSDQNADETSRIVTEEFDRRIKEDKQVQLQFWKLIWDFVCFGRGHLMWEDASNWRFKHVPLSRVMFPDATDIDTRLWDYFCIRQEVPVAWLWKRIRNEGSASSAGWNIAAARQAIRGAVPDDPERGWTDYIRVQQELADNDLYVSSRASKIKLANLFVKEFSGDWSWYIVCENYLQGRLSSTPASAVTANAYPTSSQSNMPPIADSQTFLFSRVNAYPSVDQFLGSFYLDVCGGSINGLQGLAHEIYSFVMVKDRMINTIADNTFFRSALILQAQTADAAQRAAVTLIGNTVVVPPNVAIQNSQVIGDVETSLGVVRDFDARVQNNTGVYRPQLVKPTGNPRTATEAELNYSQAATLTASAVNRFYDQLDLTWAESYRRMVAYDQEFKNRLKERDVNPSVLKNPWSVRASRVIGSGSLTERRQAVASLMTFYNQYPENGKRALLAAVTAAYTDQHKVEEFMPKADIQNLPTRHEWEATQENAALLEGAPVIWTPEQNDLIHAQVHVGAAVQALESASQQSDLPKIVSFCDGVVAHVATTHLPRLEASNKDAAKAIGATMKKVMQGSKQLKGVIQQQQRQAAAEQQRAQQLTVDQQLDAAQAQHKMQMAEQKVQHSAMLKSHQVGVKNRLAEMDLMAGIQRDDAATAAKIQQDTALTASEIQQTAAKTAADINLANKKAAKTNGKTEKG